MIEGSVASATTVSAYRLPKKSMPHASEGADDFERPRVVPGRAGFAIEALAELRV